MDRDIDTPHEKWGPPPDPFTLEARLREIKPPASMLRDYMEKAKQEDMLTHNTTSRRAAWDYHEVEEAREHARIACEQDFHREFTKWLIGKSKYNTITIKGKGESLINLTPWKDCSAANHNSEIAGYIDSYVDNKTDYSKKRRHLRLRGPTNLHEYLLYFKHIIVPLTARKAPYDEALQINDYLDDWQPLSWGPDAMRIPMDYKIYSATQTKNMPAVGAYSRAEVEDYYDTVRGESKAVSERSSEYAKEKEPAKKEELFQELVTASTGVSQTVLTENAKPSVIKDIALLRDEIEVIIKGADPAGAKDTSQIEALEKQREQFEKLLSEQSAKVQKLERDLQTSSNEAKIQLKESELQRAKDTQAYRNEMQNFKTEAQRAIGEQRVKHLEQLNALQSNMQQILMDRGQDDGARNLQLEQASLKTQQEIQNAAQQNADQMASTVQKLTDLGTAMKHFQAEQTTAMARQQEIFQQQLQQSQQQLEARQRQEAEKIRAAQKAEQAQLSKQLGAEREKMEGAVSQIQQQLAQLQRQKKPKDRKKLAMLEGGISDLQSAQRDSQQGLLRIEQQLSEASQRQQQQIQEIEFRHNAALQQQKMDLLEQNQQQVYLIEQTARANIAANQQQLNALQNDVQQALLGQQQSQKAIEMAVDVPEVTIEDAPEDEPVYATSMDVAPEQLLLEGVQKLSEVLALPPPETQEESDLAAMDILNVAEDVKEIEHLYLTGPPEKEQRRNVTDRDEPLPNRATSRREKREAHLRNVRGQEEVSEEKIQEFFHGFEEIVEDVLKKPMPATEDTPSIDFVVEDLEKMSQNVATNRKEITNDQEEVRRAMEKLTEWPQGVGSLKEFKSTLKKIDREINIILSKYSNIESAIGNTKTEIGKKILNKKAEATTKHKDAMHDITKHVQNVISETTAENVTALHEVYTDFVAVKKKEQADKRKEQNQENISTGQTGVKREERGKRRRAEYKSKN